MIVIGIGGEGERRTGADDIKETEMLSLRWALLQKGWE
jgi:hypothetical protein